MTSTSTLTDRYVDAAMRGVPEKQRADLAAELRGSIADQIDARIEAGEPAQSAEREVLIELGDPDKLAAGYLERPLWLVGPRYYLDWWRLLKLLWAIVPVCAAFGVALGQTLAGASFGEIVGSVVGVVIAVIVHVAFWVTLVFVILERTGHETMDPAPWTPDRLPEPKASGAGFGDMIASLVFLAIGVGAVLWDHFVGWPVGGGERLPFLDPGLWPWWIAALFVVMALEAILAVTVHARGRWTMGLAAGNAVINVVFAVAALWLLAGGRLVNPDFFPTVIPEDAAEVAGILGIILGFVIGGVAIWSSIDAFLKARRAR
ncbi:permease prefix domain 1-containing protein [Microbacterium sp. B2969]|uniref:Permease prefix domain 1-containing protein n=1 Tax=Microbacterium alkaliflavum TaxID=3248839 RepID=A0ABW7Q269_9MICO